MNQPAPTVAEQSKLKEIDQRLTAAQKQKWDDLTGEPFLQKIEMPRGTAPFSPPVPKK